MCQISRIIIIKMMMRLLLKIHQVKIRLKEKVHVQLLISQNSYHFVLPSKPLLENTVAVFNSHIEFFVSQKSNGFEIQVMLLWGGAKKFAGMCRINLSDWNENHCNRTEAFLEKSPDSQALIAYDFIFLSTDIPELSRGLISLEEYQQIRKSKIIKQIEEKNNILTQQNSRLTNQVETLKKENKVLEQDKMDLECENDRNEEKFQDQLKKKAQEMEQSHNRYEEVCSKMKEVIELVNEFGEKNLIRKIQPFSHSQF